MSLSEGEKKARFHVREKLGKTTRKDWTHFKRQLSTDGDNGRTDGREEGKRNA